MRLSLFRHALAALSVAAMAFCSAESPAFAAPAGAQVDITARAVGTYNGTANIAGQAVFPFELKSLLQLSPGTGAGKADLMYSSTQTIAPSSSANLDLAGVLTDPLGATLTFVKVKAILVVASCSNTNNFNLGGAASNTFVGPFADATDIVSIKPCGAALFTSDAGWTVTPSTGDILKEANSSSGTSVTAQVIIIGTSS